MKHTYLCMYKSTSQHVPIGEAGAEEGVIKRLNAIQPPILKAAIERGLKHENRKNSNSSGPKTEQESACEKNLRALQRR